MKIGDEVSIPQDGIVVAVVVETEEYPDLVTGEPIKKIWVEYEGRKYGYAAAAVEPIYPDEFQDLQ